MNMKLFKILLGVFFGLWAIGTVVGALVNERDKWKLNAWGLTDIAALVGAAAMLALFSAWSFESAFKKPADEKDAVQPPPDEKQESGDVQ